MSEPLAYRMRPRTVDEICGQDDAVGSNSLLKKLIEQDCISSLILYGPPGTGKTTIAEVIANSTKAQFKKINAVAGSKKDIESVCLGARKLLESDINAKTILFIDEIHRFNKAQQDYLLPFVEDGTITLIGATTENPYFEVNPALVSRSVIIELKPLAIHAIKTVILRALVDPDRGLGASGLDIDADALDFLSIQAGGDCRLALQILETAAISAQNKTSITLDDVKIAVQKPHLRYDKDGDMHYDVISAFIKSMRGSDPDAVLYWLARMIESGEDPKFIARRIMICASEDVGNADPQALVIAVNASLACERLGWPESRITLAQAALYVAMAPKSNSAITGIDAALDYVKSHPLGEVPPHLRDAHYKSAAKLGHGLDYIYPHDCPNHWTAQQYLPDSVTERFYKNSHMSYEHVQADYQNMIRRTP